MAKNKDPLFSAAGILGFATLTTANTATDGTGTVATLFTAGADGAYLQRVQAKSKGTNVASVLRLFLNKAAPTSTASNNALLADAALPATTSSQVAPLNPVELFFDVMVPAGYSLTASIGTTVAAGWDILAVSGDYTA